MSTVLIMWLLANVLLCPYIDKRDNQGFHPLLFASLSPLFSQMPSLLRALIRFDGYAPLVNSSPFCMQDRGHSHLCECDANRSGRSDSRRCRGRSWRHQSPAAPCTEGTPWGRPSFQGCGTSYWAAKVSVEVGLRAQGWRNMATKTRFESLNVTEKNISWATLSTN